MHHFITFKLRHLENISRNSPISWTVLFCSEVVNSPSCCSKRRQLTLLTAVRWTLCSLPRRLSSPSSVVLNSCRMSSCATISWLRSVLKRLELWVELAQNAVMDTCEWSNFDSKAFGRSLLSASGNLCHRKAYTTMCSAESMHHEVDLHFLSPLCAAALDDI